MKRRKGKKSLLSGALEPRLCDVRKDRYVEVPDDCTFVSCWKCTARAAIDAPNNPER